MIATAIAAAALLTALGAAGGPALAATQRHHDPRDDVENVAPRTAVRARPKPGIDVVSLENTYRGRKLNLSMTMANLMRKSYAAQWYIATPEATYSFSYDYRGATPIIVFTPIGQRRVARGDPTSSCAKVSVVATRNTLTGTVPARCIGSADGVRVAGYTSKLAAMSSLDVDDSRQNGLGDGSNIDYGPVLAHN